MTTIAVTGPTKLSQVQAIYVHRKVQELRADRFVSGCAYGVDTQAILEAWESHEGAQFTLTIPKGEWHNKALAEFGASVGWDIEYIDGGYMARNDRTIELTDVLIAFPETPDEVLRSGTWATVRRAQRKGIPFTIYPLSDLG